MKNIVFLLTILFSFEYCKSEATSIFVHVSSEQNQSTVSLIDQTLTLMIKDQNTHNHLYFSQMKINQNAFPFHFNLTNIKQIKQSGTYFIILFIFEFPHRLLWESILSRQYLSANSPNHINFTVNDFSNSPKCLSPGYPCLDKTNDISQCCSSMKCEQSEIGLRTCNGHRAVIYHLIVVYTLPLNVELVVGPINNRSLEVTETILQAKLGAELLVQINNGSILNRNQNSHEKYRLQFHLSIITSESCHDCLNRVKQLIEAESIPFQVQLFVGSFIIIQLQQPLINITNAVGTPESEPIKDVWMLTNNLTYPRTGHTASILPNGSVLVVGGVGNDSIGMTAELYDPLSNTWTFVANMTYPRLRHTASVILNSSVLVVGGSDDELLGMTAEQYYF